MISKRFLLLSFLGTVAVWPHRSAAADPDWLPLGLLPPAPAQGVLLCRGAFLTPEQGKAVLAAAQAHFTTAESWQSYARLTRTAIQRGMGLEPWPRKTPLNAMIRDRRVYNGYSVESVAFESVPGFYATGSLYRPLGRRPPYPAVITTHGHTGPAKTPADYDRHGRYSPDVQLRAASLARMGAIVLAIDMFGYGDSIPAVGQEAHARPFSMTIQTWNAIRAIDLLCSMSDVDAHCIAMTGESGGGTQDFLVAALDSRIAVSVPVVMVSSYFFGGCPCESGLPVHRSEGYFADNTMIAALVAPRPMLVVSDGQDWTRETPEVVLPFLRSIYALEGSPANVANAHFAAEGHDYGPSKRAAAYRFLADRLHLDLTAAFTPTGELDETKVTIEPSARMRVYDPSFPLPAGALHGAVAVEHALRAIQAAAAP